MSTLNVCAKCGSEKIIPKVHIKDHTDNGDRGLTAEICEHPEALLFRGAQRELLVGRVCGQCGFTELYAESPGTLWQAHLKSTGK